MPDEHLSRRPQFKQDRHRPLYHFLPPAHWMNDPNGLIQWQGEVHLFYQHNPHGPLWGTIHWGHAVSRDLVHWQDLPLALAPSPGGPDKDGCWSGCAIEHEGQCVLFYTGDFPQVQCMATSDDMITWHKYTQNPVIAAPPPVLDVVGTPWDLRDPWVWREGNFWNMMLGSGLKDQGGAVLLYQSTDLIHWTFVQPILTGRLAPDGAVWECPNLFSLNERDVLLISEQPESRHTYYLVGDYVDHQFIPSVQGKTDYGPYFYAALTLLDDRQHRLMWGWLKEGRTLDAQRNSGWSGVMSLPRVLTVRSDGRLGMAPAPELEILRHKSVLVENLTLTPGGGQPLARMNGDCLEILLEGRAVENTRFEILLRCSP
ncbi:MAG: glycoside hydrolase family 32 protein, partial [Chloroflexi bacterium]|nr:glycoside hydrolase family 32 protein [Chloroflexota bacterium]